MILYKRNNQVYYEDIGGTGEIRGVPDVQVEFDNHSSDSRITISIFRYQDRDHKNFFRQTFDYDQVFDENSVAYGDSFLDITDGYDRGVDVNIQDQTTRPIIAKFNRVTNSTTLASDASLEDTTIAVTSATGISVGSYIILFNPIEVKFAFATVTSIAGSPTITLDTPLDFAFPSGTFVDVAVTDISTAIGTLGSPVVFGLRGTGAPPGVDLDVDITRIIFTCVANSPVNLIKFCNLARLVNGLVLRRRNDVYENIFNIKDNGEIAGIMFDFNVSVATNPSQGIDGFVSRLTFAGSSKIGVAIRLPIGDDLEVLTQDDLNTAQSGDSITLLEMVAEGHIVEP